jgi:hypothetical protein
MIHYGTTHSIGDASNTNELPRVRQPGIARCAPKGQIASAWLDQG